MKKFFTVLSFSILLLLALSINTFAMEYPSDLPALPNKGYYFNGYQEFFSYKGSDGRDYLILVGKNDANTPVEYKLLDENTLAIKNNDTHTDNWYKIFIFRLVAENGSWTKLSEANLTPKNQTTVSITNATFRYTEVDILNSDGTVFFPHPPTPPQTVEEMVAEETPKMAEKVIQTMKIILLCGVGCLAFLVCLVILPKVLFRFL